MNTTYRDTLRYLPPANPSFFTTFNEHPMMPINDYPIMPLYDIMFLMLHMLTLRP